MPDEEAKRAAYEELMAYIEECAEATKGWEGELLEDDEVSQRYGISAEQLDALRGEGKAMAFPKSAGGYVYPAAQFVDCNVVAGIDHVAEVVQINGECWLFLTQRSPYLDGDVPLDRLKRGDLAAVVEAAHMQYDL
ncbi:hypothetical protein ACFSAG_09545 [Sphingorhabdus buctiana]|uniref:DUF2384 domain-containing protein n=1 Tax=Sphingorhabdus buctiana TaxID=1508805 RepID=A0ABW4MDV2_9SPHN